MHSEPLPSQETSPPNKETNFKPRVKSIPIQQTELSTPPTYDAHLRVDTIKLFRVPIINHDAHPRVDVVKPSIVSPLALQPMYMSQRNPSSEYRYSTRLKVAKAATLVQLE